MALYLNGATMYNSKSQLDLSDTTRQQLKVHATATRQTMSQVAEQILSDYYEQHPLSELIERTAVTMQNG